MDQYFKTKHNADDNVDRHKARLAAKGLSQGPGIGYKETFSPAARLTSIRTLLALSINV